MKSNLAIFLAIRLIKALLRIYVDGKLSIFYEFVDLIKIYYKYSLSKKVIGSKDFVKIFMDNNGCEEIILFRTLNM